MTDSRHPAPGPGRQKPVLTPPGTGSASRKESPLQWLLLALGLLLLLGAAAMVIWLLPHTAGLKNSSGNLPAPQLQPTANEPELERPEAVRAEVEKLLGEWLKLQARAEADNVSVWGADAYPSILAETAGADLKLQEGEFTGALAAYKKAITHLQEVLNSKEERLISALTKGNMALNNHDSSEAVESFDLALAIAPNNEQALKGMTRAQNLEQVLLLYNKGLDHERGNELTAARETLYQATVLDKEFNPAQIALQRVEERQREIAFQAAMNNTLKALAENDTAAARRSLAKAARLRPNDISLKDAERRLTAMEKAQKLLHLQGKAEKMAAAENWSEALQVYDEALAIDPHFGFAESGRKFSLQRSELDRHIQQILARPGRLQEKGPLAEAEHILAKAQSIDNPGPILRNQIMALSELVRTASTPVNITLISDNETNVVIYRIGRLGKFLEKSLDLLPGSYTVVGSCPGFRDVRLTLTIQAGDNPNILDIRCKEPI